jgi:hypothetical protein
MSSFATTTPRKKGTPNNKSTLVFSHSSSGPRAISYTDQPENSHSFSFARGTLELTLSEADRRALRVTRVATPNSALTNYNNNNLNINNLNGSRHSFDPATTLQLWLLPAQGDSIDQAVNFGIDALRAPAARFGANLAHSIRGVNTSPCAMKMVLCKVDVGRSIGKRIF